MASSCICADWISGRGGGGSPSKDAKAFFMTLWSGASESGEHPSGLGIEAGMGAVVAGSTDIISRTAASPCGDGNDALDGKNAVYRMSSAYAYGVASINNP